MTKATIACRRLVRMGILLASAFLTMATLEGCEVDSYLDPSRTGYFEFTPTTMPVLKRLDVVEQVADDSTIIGPPGPEDLIPNQREYTLAPGDRLKVEIYELQTRGETEVSVREVDPDGYIHLPVVQTIPAAGLTVEQVTERIKARLRQGIIANPQVTVTIEEARAFQYQVMGAVERPGLFALNRPDLRLMNALALAQGALPSTRKIRVIRPVEEVMPPPADMPPSAGSGMPSGRAPQGPGPGPTAPNPNPGTKPPPGQAPSIDSLIDELNIGDPSKKGAAPPSTPPPGAAPPSVPPGAPPASPGALRGQDSAPPPRPAAPPVDIDSLEPVRISDNPKVTVGDARIQKVSAVTPSDGSTYAFDQEKQEWVKVKPGEAPPPAATAPLGARTGKAAAATTPQNKRYSGPPTRVIEIGYDDLVNGVGGLNIIIRPGDTIYCDAGERGVVYIDGEVQRPGVYQLPEGGHLTVSRLISAAGGLGQIAIPERCDLIRKIGEDREACLRFSLAAIRNRGEPDIYMKPDDHVIVGTNFWATPLAVIRNGFRMTYGFGFLLDRNFGNDVFGPPPVNVVGQ